MMKKLKENIKYYFWATYRRKFLDKFLEENESCYKGIVLDIGGRDRGKFKKPKDEVEKWIFADIEEKHKPDIVLDVSDMSEIKDEGIDVVSAIELFEHVEKIEQGLRECYRVLKKDGTMILSVPFLYPIHSDPFDFQRWTIDKWKKELEKIGFKIEKFEIMGRFFTVTADYVKVAIKSAPRPLKYFLYIFYPFLDLLAELDKSNFVENHPRLGKFHGGYFIIGRK